MRFIHKGLFRYNHYVVGRTVKLVLNRNLVCPVNRLCVVRGDRSGGPADSAGGCEGGRRCGVC